MGRPKKDSPMKGKKRKMNKDPNKPKRPTSAYFYYAEFCRAELKAQNKKITKVGDFTKEVSKKWGALSESSKKPYTEKAAKDRARYDTQMAAYKGKDANKPKRPQSSYFCFLADFRIEMKKKHSDLDHKAILTKAGEKWKSLSAAEKRPYEDAAEKEKAKYVKAMEEYNRGGGAAAAAKKAKMDLAALNGQDESEEEDEEEDDEEDDDDEYDDDE